MNTEQITISETKENSQIRWMFYIELAVLIALVFVRNVLKAEIPVLVFLALTAIIALLGTKEEIVTLGICCIPLSVAFQYKYTLLICILVYCFKYPKDVKLNQYVFPLLCMMIWDFLHAVEYDFTYNEYFRSFSEMIFCTFLMLCTYKKYDYGKICRILAVCTIFMIFMLILNLLKETNYSFEMLFSGGYRLGKVADAEDFTISYNSNELGYMCLIPVMGLLQIMSNGQRKITDIVMIVVLLTMGTLTMSRMFLICTVLMFVLFLCSWQTNLVGKIKGFAFVIMFLLIGILLLFLFMPYVMESFMERFQVEDISNGRNDLFAFYTEHIFSKDRYLYFGVGLQNMVEKVRELYGITRTVWNTTHNAIQEIVVAWGAFGLLMVASFIYSIIQSSKHEEEKRKFIYFIPLIMLLVKVQAGQMITSGVTMLTFSFVYIGMCTRLDGKNHED